MSKKFTRLVGPQKRDENHKNLPCKITKSKCQTIPTIGLNQKPQRALDGKEVIRLVSHDLVRDLVVPHDKPNIYPGMVDVEEFNRLKAQAKVLSFEDRLRAVNEVDALKDKKLRESDERKADIKKWEKKREKGVRLNDLELEARKRADQLLKRAEELRQEQEDEVKAANRLILGTKCHAIRDAQIAEKKLIQKELEAEERRLDQMMEDARRESLRAEEKKREEQKIRNEAYTRQILEQVRENDTERLVAAERIEEEARRMNQAFLELQLDECRAVKEKAAAGARVREDLKQFNQQLQYFRELEDRDAHVADLRIHEYNRKKNEREAAREAELKLIKVAKQREIERLLTLQQRAQDTQADMENQSAQRIADDAERKWRQAEREAARSKARQDADMKAARETQILDRRRMEALEIERERREFERILAVQREGEELAKIRAQQKANKVDKHREAILGQINEKEYERHKQRKELFEEGLAIKLEEERRHKALEEVMARKINELKANKVPDVYIKEIEKQIRLKK